MTDIRLPGYRRRWFEAADLRHATVGPPVLAGAKIPTLCGTTAIAVHVTPGRCAAECPACDRRWRAAEGIAQRQEHRPHDAR
ncbi:MAG TPA: hypothetical protein VGG05_02750 [Pseudonocardiaceae bacterium]|jgi:hypothetical protein